MSRLPICQVVMLVVSLLLTACKPEVPSQYLQPDEMEDLMYDYYVSQGITVNNSSSPDYQHRYHLAAVLKKYGLTDAQFDSSLVYYYNHMEQMNDIYSNIQKRLSDEALALGASEGEVERFTIKSASGDTTDVWEGNRFLMLHPVSPYHVVQFSQKADSSFHAGDSFLLTFGSKFLTQSGSRNALAYLAVTYDNDSVVYASSNVSISGGTTVRIAACDKKAKRIDGFFHLSRQTGSDNKSELCMLFIDHVQLMRFHHRKDAKQKEETPPEVSPVRSDSIDSLRPRRRRLGERPIQLSSEADSKAQVDIRQARENVMKANNAVKTDVNAAKANAVKANAAKANAAKANAAKANAAKANAAKANAAKANAAKANARGGSRVIQRDQDPRRNPVNHSTPNKYN